MAEHLPNPDPAVWPSNLSADQQRTLESDVRLFRFYDSSGANATRWHEFRHWGPTSARFDHHPNGTTTHPNHSVWYGAVETTDSDGKPTGLLTAVAERFQDSRTLPLHTTRISLVVCSPAQKLVLLDLESSWLTQAGGNAAITSGPRAQSRKWARAIRQTYPTVGGLAWRSSVYRPGLAVVLWDLPRSALAERPLLNRQIRDVVPFLLPVANELNYRHVYP